MSDIEKSLVHKLINTPAVAAIVSSRVYPNTLPQTVEAFPAAVYQLIGGTQVQTHGEASSLRKPRCQITCWGTTFAEVVAADEVIRVAIDGKRETWGVSPFATVIHACLVQTQPRDDADPDTGLYIRSRDYFIQYS